MRELKFRLRIGDKIVGWEKWIAGGWIYKPLNDVWSTKIIPHTDKDQFTGLRDKKGVDAYFGDFYRMPDWVHGEKIRLIPLNASYRELTQIAEDFRECQPEIIGNVFQNKDLLEVKKS